jgi:membrane protease YdiL (CAAX protease family)
MTVFLAAIFGVGVLGFLGLIGLLVIVVRLMARNLRGGLEPGFGNGGIYAETFALWMFWFLLLGEVGRAVAGGSNLLVAGLMSLFSLTALMWPLARGVPWEQLRQDIGWTAGVNPAVEILLGPACYAMTLPLMFVGLLMTLMLLVIQGILSPPEPDSFTPVSLPSHPIVAAIRGGNWATRLQLLFVASVAAPIVEETMFRGVLYRHLRDATWGWGRLASIFVSVLLTSFIFAVIHPQGLVAVPALMGIAIGLNLTREWRQTLIPGMIAHGINNGILLTLLSVALG